MTQVYFCSDFHLGHKNIAKFRCREKGFFRDFQDESEHRNWLKDEWHRIVTKRDKVFCLGDMCFSKDILYEFGGWVGNKVLVAGNHCLGNCSMHDIVSSGTYSDVYSLFKYKNFWLSHAPIHNSELRGKRNLHGHTHYYTVDDDDYLNCCVENVYNINGSVLISLPEVLSYFEKQEE